MLVWMSSQRSDTLVFCVPITLDTCPMLLRVGASMQRCMLQAFGGFTGMYSPLFGIYPFVKAPSFDLRAPAAKSTEIWNPTTGIAKNDS